MKLFQIRPKDNLQTSDPWKPWYDKCFGFIIRAKTKPEARKIASENAGDEGKNAWLDGKYSTCEELKIEGKADLIMKDFASA